MLQQEIHEALSGYKKYPGDASILKNFSSLATSILAATDYIQVKSLRARIQAINLGWIKIPLCPICQKNQIKFDSRTNYWTECCSSNCLRIKTCREKYGTDSISASSEVKKRKIQTCLEHFGVENP